MSAKGRRAFTLLELLVTLAIMAAILGISAPALSRFFAGRSMIEEARRLSALTRYARDQAVATGAPMRVWLDTDDRQYGVIPQSGFGLDENKEKIYDFPNDMEVEVNSGELDENGQWSVRYLPDGILDEDSATEVTFINRKDDRIRIYRETGKAWFQLSEESDDRLQTP